MFSLSRECTVMANGKNAFTYPETEFCHEKDGRRQVVHVIFLDHPPVNKNIYFPRSLALTFLSETQR